MYGTGGTVSSSNAAFKTAPRSTSMPSNFVDNPQSRLSKRITYKFLAANILQYSVSHLTIWAPWPSIKIRAGFFGSPNVSYSISIVGEIFASVIFCSSYSCNNRRFCTSNSSIVIEPRFSSASRRSSCSTIESLSNEPLPLT
ncbi:unannotated protein [freshwater metagenome]|uniref:Unannotated protein n=1 Tax=freshwater metagenome TaxID=449393 RepID=A0A6J6GV17_9ZZZZ